MADLPCNTVSSVVAALSASVPKEIEGLPAKLLKALYAEKYNSETPLWHFLERAFNDAKAINVSITFSVFKALLNAPELQKLVQQYAQEGFILKVWGCNYLDEDIIYHDDEHAPDKKITRIYYDLIPETVPFMDIH